MNEVLSIDGLKQSFGGTTVLDDVSFSIVPSERLAVMGASGSGKTTMMRLIAGLETPQAGEISIAGRTASRAGEVLIAPEHRGVALVFQGLALFPHLNALDQIAFATRGRGGITQAKSLLERVGLGHRGDARLDQLSGGERQRIALARALAQEPKVILMDEPFASLDDEKRGEMRDLLRSLLEKSETTLVLVTHSRDDALDLARRVLVLERGRTAAHDLLENVLAHPRHAAVVRALGLGQILEGEIIAPGLVETAFGKAKVSLPPDRKNGRAKILVRPAQAKMMTDADGVEAEIFSFELRPPESHEVRRVALVRKDGKILRVFITKADLSISDRVRVKIEGECELLEG